MHKSCPKNKVYELQIAVAAHQDTKDGYKLAFHFADNIYFDAAVLEKQINFVTDPETGSQTCHTTGSQPKWKQQVDIVPYLLQFVSRHNLAPGDQYTSVSELRM